MLLASVATNTENGVFKMSRTLKANFEHLFTSNWCALLDNDKIFRNLVLQLHFVA